MDDFINTVGGFSNQTKNGIPVEHRIEQESIKSFGWMLFGALFGAITLVLIIKKGIDSI